MINIFLIVLKKLLDQVQYECSQEFNLSPVRMNKHALQTAVIRQPSKQINRIKDKLRDNQARNKQYESLCIDGQDHKHIHAIMPYGKQRKISKKEIRLISSPAKLSRSKSKKQFSGRKIEMNVDNKNISQLYYELMTVKSQYKNLKNSYNVLLTQKNQITARQQTERNQISTQLQRCHKQLEKQTRMTQTIEQEIERIKRQCYKIIQNQHFKHKKLEQIIQQKDLMIAFLRNQIDKMKKGVQTAPGSSINQSALSFLQTSAPGFNFDFVVKGSANVSMMSNVIIDENPVIKSKSHKILEDDSLSFSRDKSKDMQSIHSFLTNHDQTINNFTKKDIVIVQSSQSDSSQGQSCLTFEQRGEDEKLFAQHQSQKETKKYVPSIQLLSEKLQLPNQNKKQKSQSYIAPKSIANSKQKNRQNSKKLLLVTDQNVDNNKQQQSVSSKKQMTSSVSSRQKKKGNFKKYKV